MFKSNMWTLFNYGQISASFVYFRPFHTTIQMWIVKSIDRCCTWDSNTGTQDGGCRWIHLAMGAPRYWDKFFKICHSRPLFIYIRLFYKQLTLNNYSTKFRTWALWNQELPRCRLPQQLPTATTTADCHNNCPTGISYCLHFQKVKRLKWRQYFLFFQSLWSAGVVSVVTCSSTSSRGTTGRSPPGSSSSRGARSSRTSIPSSPPLAFFSSSVAVRFWKIYFFEMGLPQSLFHLFPSIQTHFTFFTTNKYEKMSIQYTVPGYELIITRPGLPPKLLKKYWIAQNEMIHRTNVTICWNEK